MSITTPVASAVVRDVLKMEAAKDGIPSSQQKAMTKCKVMFANDHLLEGEDEFIGWWAVGKQPATSKDILLSELVGIAGGWASGIMGATVDTGTVGTVLDVIGDIHKGVETATGSVSQGIYNKLSDAWKAGTYSSAIGTRDEFTIFAQDMVLGGPIYMKKGLETITGSTTAYDKTTFFQFMGHAERADGRDGTNRTKEYAENGSWKFILPLTP